MGQATISVGPGIAGYVRALRLRAEAAPCTVSSPIAGAVWCVTIMCPTLTDRQIADFWQTAVYLGIQL